MKEEILLYYKGQKLEKERDDNSGRRMKGKIIERKETAWNWKLLLKGEA